MLVYAVSRCRGYVHARNLGEGIDPLSRVWLLLCLLGMETMPDRLQRTTVPLPPQKKKQDNQQLQGEEIIQTE
uniref:Uncharacterized protein n=1 Tax=Oryza glumipatula TaxID=40148 RepID=A0A0D9ZWD6_9ORYZ